MKWLKKNRSTIIFTIIFFIGLSLLLYPSISDFWNTQHQSRAIAGYTKEVDEMKEIEYEQIWKKAEEYNQTLVSNQFRWILNESEEKQYEDLLNVSKLGIMCYIEIPKIRLSLPVYHGVDETVLQTAIGHITGSSLPVGGKGTHCVLSGHRGLPSAKLFTNLDQLEKGDYFILHTLNKSLIYEVDQIQIVEPEEVSALEIEDGKDLCTLVTCTPYGVNSHRLLVRGHRTTNMVEDGVNFMADAVKIDSFEILAASLILLLLICFGIVGYRKRKKEEVDQS